MVVKIYIWRFEGKKSGENWGHASMALSDGTYISWWPERPLGSKTIMCIPFEWVTASRDRSLQDDEEGEGKKADYVAYLDDGILNEEAIKEWWQGFKSDNKFNGMVKNCSTVVFRALKVGGALKYVRDPKNLVWHPNEIQRFAIALLDNFKSKSDVPSEIQIDPLPNDLQERMEEIFKISELDLDFIDD